MKLRYQIMFFLVLSIFFVSKNISADEKDFKIKETIKVLNLENERIVRENNTKIKLKNISISNDIDKNKLISYKINEKSSIMFDEKGNLLNLNRASELKRDFNTKKILDSHEKEKIIKNLSFLLPKDFKLKEEQEILGYEGTKFIFSNDKGNLENKYNVVIVSVENITGRIITYSRIEEFNKKIFPYISVMNAESIADKYLKENKFYTKYIKTKFVIDKIKDGKPKPIYKVIYKDVSVWIDGSDGRVLLLDKLKGMEGKAFYVSLTFEPENAVNLREIMSILGYNTSIEYANSDKIKSYLKGYYSYGFTFSGHGSSNSIASDFGDVYPSDVSGVWKFVFLDSCNSANGYEWSNAFNIYDNSKNRIFMGWYTTVEMTLSNKFCRNLNLCIKDDSSLYFYTNLWNAINKTDDYYPIRFRGDKQWNGKI